jgi:cytochrome P450
MGFRWMLTLMPYGEEWRRGRRLIHTHFSQSAVPSYYPAQVTAARRLARDLLNAPQQPDTLTPLVQLNFAQTIIKILYGIDAHDENDPYVSTSEKVVEALNISIVPGRFLVDFMPFCECHICFLFEI